jgi:hypothetical protein
MSLNEKYMLCTAIGFSAGLVVCAVVAMAVWPDLRRMRTRGQG